VPPRKKSAAPVGNRLPVRVCPCDVAGGGRVGREKTKRPDSKPPSAPALDNSGRTPIVGRFGKKGG